MRKTVFSLFVFALFSCWLPSLVAAEILLDQRGRGYIIGGDENFPPYEFVVDIGGVRTYRGFNVDIMRAVALQTGIEIELRPMTWAAAITALDVGQLDAVQGMKQDAQRSLKYDFAEYLISSQSIFVLQDTIVVALEDLQGKKIAVQNGDIAYQTLREAAAYQLVVVDDQEQAFKLLLSGQVTAVVGNRLAGQYILQNSKQVERVKMIGPQIASGDYGLAVRKGDTQLLTTIRKGIAEIKSNGIYDKIYKKWFGDPVEYPSEYYKDRLIAALATTGLLLLGLAFMLYISYILRKEVNNRTKQIQQINHQLMDRNEYIKRENIHKEKVLNSGYSGIVTLDCHGCIQFINSYAEKYLGCNQIGLHYSQTFVQDFFSGIQGSSVLQEGKERGSEKTIRGRLMEYTITTLAGNEQDSGLVITFRDVTIEKQMREQIIRKDKMESLGNLVAGIAHEIRNPLTSIKTFAEVLPEKYDNPAFRQKMSLHVPREVQRIDVMVNDLLDFARPRKPFAESIALYKLVRDVVVLFGALIKKASISIKIQIGPEVIVHCDKQQLQQVLINVLLNAIEELEQVSMPCIIISSTQTIKSVTIALGDNGRGLEEKLLSKIFDPFFTTKPAGTGLGLAISQQFIVENGGNIWARNGFNKGTTFYIQLPKSSEGGSHVQINYS